MRAVELRCGKYDFGAEGNTESMMTQMRMKYFPHEKTHTTRKIVLMANGLAITGDCISSKTLLFIFNIDFERARVARSHPSSNLAILYKVP